ncbi:MAG: hypothetical protein HY875_17275 [Chloroflexi bacterium]|nr:hypothetical protein [Chloroflexota bacterium]
MAADAPVSPKPSLAEAASIQAFWDKHYRELLQEYPEQFVAVKDGKVIAADSDLATLVEELRARGIDVRTDVAIQFISAGSASLQL